MSDDVAIRFASVSKRFKRGDRVYIVSPVSPFDPSDTEIEELAFSKELLAQAPNPAMPGGCK